MPKQQPAQPPRPFSASLDDALEERNSDQYAPIDDLAPLPEMPEPWPEFATPQQQGKQRINELRQTVAAVLAKAAENDGTTEI